MTVRLELKYTVLMAGFVLASGLLMGMILGAQADSMSSAQIDVDGQLADFKADNPDVSAWKKKLVTGLLWAGFTLANIGIVIGYHVLRHVPTPILEVWFNAVPLVLLAGIGYVFVRDLRDLAADAGVIG